MTDPLVSAQWLSDHLDQVVVLDATYFLPPDPARSRAEHTAMRIPGAQLFAIDEIADTTSDLPHMLPTEAHFSKAIAALGIDGSCPVVVYDRSANHFSAPRVWFTLRLFGIGNAFVLDGGLNAWTAAGFATESGAALAPQPVAPKAWGLDRTRVLSGLEVHAATAARDAPIFDARSQDRFDGAAPEPRAGLNSGHMPGSSCIPFPSFTTETGLFASPTTIRAIFGELSDAAPILSCGSGMTACVLALALERIGVSARLYDGSWADWGRGHLGAILTKAS
jgi:thiosulfate/3-mercaptopyruvate sulfurtransferase